MEEAAAKPQEDGMCSRFTSCLGVALSSFLAFAHDAKPLVVGLHYCCLFVKVLLGSVPEVLGLAFVCGTLVKKALGCNLVDKLMATSILLLFVGGVLVEKALAGHCLMAMVLVLPQFVHEPLPVLVGGFLASATSGKNRPPHW